MTKASFGVYIFSYNRGKYITNAVNSALQCGFDNDQVTVVDDNSDDLKTLEDLEILSQKVTVKNAGAADEHETLGGLYVNMQWAITDANRKNYKYCLFVQDDMQFIRPFSETDIKNIEGYFALNTQCLQLQPCFLKKHQQDIDNKFSAIDPSNVAYLRSIDFPGYASFSAVGLFHVERFDAALHSLESTEYLNNLKANKLGIQLGYYVFPFMMYLPFPISHREGERTTILKIIEFIGKSGFYPLNFMSEEQYNLFMQRDIRKKAYAEDWLQHPELSDIEIWTYGGGISKLQDRGGWRSHLAKILRLLNDARLSLKEKRRKTT